MKLLSNVTIVKIIWKFLISRGIFGGDITIRRKNMLYDQFNTPILEGSFITYPRRQGADMWMRVGKVVKVNNVDRSLKVVADTGENFNTVTLRKMEHITVIHPAQIEHSGYNLEDFQ
jgi:hypothetical protein